MLLYVKSKEETKTSKRIIGNDLSGNEVKCLVNCDFNSITTNTVYEVTTDGEWRGIPIAVNLSTSSSPEAELLEKMYGPKKVPKLTKIIDRMVEYVNGKPDPSNGNQPRIVSRMQFQEALTEFFKTKGDPSGMEGLRKLVVVPASVKYHDSQEGGLLRHIAKMFELYSKGFSNPIFNEYEDHPLLMVTGILFHDLGKVDQYEFVNGSWTYSEFSSYRGLHIGMALEKWAKHGEAICDILGNPDMYWDVWHLIGSHHGPTQNNLGSLMSPFGHDAWTLHGIDLVESRQEESYKIPN